MARKKQEESTRKADPDIQAVIDEQPITDTLTTNYMPYAVSVIVSRAIPEIDGLKPSHRKLLYTMYKMGLLNGGRTKCANIVGQTMRLNPHGESAIYETLVRLSRGNMSLLHPLVDSKGNFGKVYSRDMAYAASRYTEAKLEGICGEFFRDIDHDAVDLVPNYDNTMQEPTLLPTTFPNVLVNPNQGIAVGMTSLICSFNLREVCETAIALMKDPNHDVLSTMTAPDFPTGGEILYDRAEMEQIYATGRGTFKVRARYRLEENHIVVYELPYTTTVEAVMDKCAEYIKSGKIKEISDMRDETDLSGLQLTIDVKRGQDPDKLMQKLFRMTPLEDSFGCNFNILIAGTPRVMGVKEILEEWTAWRIECVKRKLFFQLTKMKDKLHLLQGLSKILLDIDRAIAIIRGTESEEDVVPNLMIGFGIDETQAEYVAEIKLRNINREYILKRVEETAGLEKEIGRLEGVLKSKAKLQHEIITELQAVIKKHAVPRRTLITEKPDAEYVVEEEPVKATPVHLFLTGDGYFKKITPQSLRMSSEQKLKEGDRLIFTAEAVTTDELVILTDRCQAYKMKLTEIDECKASVLGEYLPAKIGMDEGEKPLFAFVPCDYSGSLVFLFENGKAARIPVRSYETKTNRRRLANAYSDKSPLVAAFHFTAEMEIAFYTDNGRMLLFSTAQLTPKNTRDTQGVACLSLGKKNRAARACRFEDAHLTDAKRYRKALPSTGAVLKEEDAGQIMLDI